ncbi:hypothetical protein AAE478_008629 [Parahypoxylon ruwenzoriense]
MEIILTNSLKSGILVEKEIVVHTNESTNGDPTASHPPSVVSIIHSMPDQRRGPRAPELHEVIPALASGKMLPRQTASEERLGDLAEFFRGPPPPGNFMSIPEDFTTPLADSKWKVLKVFRKKRKGQKRFPPIIKLPDSAVSARTVAGNRHIAISIPVEYSRFSPTAASQNAISESKEAGSHQVVHSRPRLPRSSASNGDAKFPRTIAEDLDSLSTASLTRGPATLPEDVTSLAPPPKKMTLLSTVPSRDEIAPGKGKEPDKQRISDSNATQKAPMSPLGSAKSHRSPRLDSEQQTELKNIPEAGAGESELGPQLVEISPLEWTKESSQHKDVTQSGDGPAGACSFAPKEGLGNASGASKLPPVLSADSITTPVLPARTSSRKAKTTTGESSEIAGNTVINGPPPMRREVSSDHGSMYDDNENGVASRPRGSFAESLLTTEYSPKLLKAQTATAYQSVPIVVRPPSRPEVDSPLNLNFPQPPSNKADRSIQANLSPPAADESRSRKDRVRERKKRDIEELRAQLHQAQPPDLHLGPDITLEDTRPESPILGKFSERSGTRSSPRRLPKAEIPELGPIRPGLQLKTPSLSPESVLRKQRERSKSAPVVTSSSSPSPLGSPSILWDRTSYYRRRERQAEQAEREARRARHAAQALAEEKEAEERLSRQRLVQRYERLKESRTKDMEKRMYRLERNNEVMIRTMASLMETLNKLLRDEHALRRSTSSAYPATSSATEPPRRRDSSDQRRPQPLRATHSHDSPLETLRAQPTRGEFRSYRHRPQSVRLSGREGVVREGQMGTKTRPIPRPIRLQEEFEGELEPGRAREERYSDIDSYTRQLALDTQRRELRSQSDQGPRAPGMGTESGAGYSYSCSNSSSGREGAGSLETMEPLMRELQEAAGFGVERRQAELE